MYVPAIPLGGLGGLRFLERTEEDQLEALKADPEVAREVDYFRENIAAATSSDALLADRRLLEVALTAFGLESEIDKTAFIKRVLDEGVSDDRAFANRLNDRRWTDFADAFGYGDPNAGGRVSSFQAAVELSFIGDGTTDPYEDALSDGDLATFRANIGAIASIDDLLADPTTLDVALAAFGLERGFYTDDHFRQLLTEGADGSYADSLEPATWTSFASAFKGLGDGETADSYDRFEMIVVREFERRGKPPIADQDAADLDPEQISEFELQDFVTALGLASTADDALADDAFLKATRAAFGLTDASVTDAQARAILSAAASGDFSLADAESVTGWRQAGEALQESFAGGVKQTVGHAEYTIELNLAGSKLEALDYLRPEPEELPEVEAEELAYFRAQIDDIDDAAALVADERLLDVALRAFGLENEGKSLSFIQSILEEDVADADAFVNQLSDTRWRDFAAAFQGATDAQPDIWRFELEEKLTALGAPAEDIDYLRRNWNLVDDSLSLVLDPKLMDITLSAFGIEQGAFTSGFVLSMLIDDPADPNGFPAVFGDPKWIEFAEFFGTGGGRGNVALDEFQGELVERYHRQVYELQVGGVDDTLRVALNFKRQIETIAASASVATAGWLQIMGDPPLRAVMDGAFGLPSQFAQLDVEAQQRVYESRAQSVFGGSDPSVFLDSANIAKALELYLGRGAGAAQSATPGYLSLISETASFARSLNQTF